MLQQLKYWRAQCTEEQLNGFEQTLAAVCGHALREDLLHTRYQDSYHKALIYNKVIRAAIRTGERSKRNPLSWCSSSMDRGEELIRMLANGDGHLDINAVTSAYRQSLAILLRRGVLFEHEGHYCLPSEIVIEMRYRDNPTSWLTVVSKTPISILLQLVPMDAQITMLQPTPIRNELAAWLAVHGREARLQKRSDSLNDGDWGILLALNNHAMDDFEELHQWFPDMECITIRRNACYDRETHISLRKSLEQCVPEQLRKLCRLGLIHIVTKHGDSAYACVSLCEEAQPVLKPHWAKVRRRVTGVLREQWRAQACDIEYPSAWSRDQEIWRLWIALHFLPLGLTQHDKLRRNDLKKIATLLGQSDPEAIESLLDSMCATQLLEQKGQQLSPLAINWAAWSGNMRAAMLRILKGWHRWSDKEERKAVDLLSDLPTGCWLNLDVVTAWLQAQSSGEMASAGWLSLFTQHPHHALHHLNVSLGRIYFLPQFHAALQQQPIAFPAPGWRGADQQAQVHGFISAAGEIQLPPDCNHRVLDKLAGLCSLGSVEQMATLQLDPKALKRLGTDKTALKQAKTLLESIQTPLPQAVAYLFEKQQSRKPVAAVAATSMLLVLRDATAISRLHKTGFELFQPFREKPEIVLLNASADAHAFIESCISEGIMLDTLIQPAQWISGTASIKAWMEQNRGREDDWIEICYQKQRNSKPKQCFASIEFNDYGELGILGMRKSKSGYVLLKTHVSLQPKHILRLRLLNGAEVEKQGLDKLSHQG